MHWSILFPIILSGFHRIFNIVFLILVLILGGKICDGYLPMPGTLFTYVMLGLKTTYTGFCIFLFSFSCNTGNLSTDGSFYNTVIECVLSQMFWQFWMVWGGWLAKGVKLVQYCDERKQLWCLFLKNFIASDESILIHVSTDFSHWRN